MARCILPSGRTETEHSRDHTHTHTHTHYATPHCIALHSSDGHTPIQPRYELLARNAAPSPPGTPARSLRCTGATGPALFPRSPHILSLPSRPSRPCLTCAPVASPSRVPPLRTTRRPAATDLAGYVHVRPAHSRHRSKGNHHLPPRSCRFHLTSPCICFLPPLPLRHHLCHYYRPQVSAYHRPSRTCPRSSR